MRKEERKRKEVRIDNAKSLFGGVIINDNIMTQNIIHKKKKNTLTIQPFGIDNNPRTCDTPNSLSFIS